MAAGEFGQGAYAWVDKLEISYIGDGALCVTAKAFVKGGRLEEERSYDLLCEGASEEFLAGMLLQAILDAERPIAG